MHVCVRVCLCVSACGSVGWFMHVCACGCARMCCRGLQRHDRGSKASKTKINPYFKFDLGGAKAIKKRSTPVKNSNSTPDFKGEVWMRAR
jgi:hypothetical protein